MADMRSRSLGIVLATPPDLPDGSTVVRLCLAARERGDAVFLYLLDEGVRNLEEPAIAALPARGVALYCCAHGRQRRGLPLEGPASFSGLYVLYSMAASCDRLVSFT